MGMAIGYRSRTTPKMKTMNWIKWIFKIGWRQVDYRYVHRTHLYTYENTATKERRVSVMFTPL